MPTDDIIEEDVVTPPTRLPEISKEQVRDENNSDDKVNEKQESKKQSGIVEEVVTPLMKHLEIAEKHVFPSEQVTDPNSSDGKLREMFEEIKKMVKTKKDILDDRKEWEGDVIKKFSVVERHIDNILEDKECDTSDELGSIFKILNKMMENVTPSQRPQDKKTESSDSKKDEPSFLTSWDDCSMPFIDEIIDTIDPQLRQCLYCLSIFPKNSIIKRRLLIYWWIGLNLVRPEGDNTAEQIGGILFDDLLDKGILIPTIHGIRKHSNVVDRCTVDTIFHEKLISSAKKKRFLIERKKISGGSLEVCTIQKNRLDVETILNVHEKYLKSGFIKSENPKSGSVKRDSDVSSKKSEGDISSKKREGDVSSKKSEGEVSSKKDEGDDFSEKSVSDVKKIAVMQVGQWRCVDCHHIEADTTDFLNELIPNITYLSLRNISRISELPEAIAKSTSLMILDVRACHNLENLPPKSTALKNLTHLDVSMCYLLDHIPRWISALNNLEVLKGFVIGSSGNKNRCRLSDISGLRKLRKLSINIGDSNFSEEDFNILKNIPKLRSLTLTWGRVLDKSESVQEKQETKVNVTAPQNQVQQPEQPEEKQKNPNVEQEKETNVVQRQKKEKKNNQ